MSTIPVGYKQTEIGVIPEDWDVNQLKNIVTKIIDNRGKTPPLSSNASIELIETASISFVNQYPNYAKVTKFVSNDIYDSWFRGHPIKNDVLISTVGEYSGASAIMQEDRGTIAQNLIALRVAKDMNPAYVFYWTKSRNFKKQLNQVMMNQAQPSLRVPWLLNFHLEFPKSKAEQQAIAAALSDTDALIESLEKLITKKRQIKQGAMQELLSPKEGWEVKKLGDVGKCHRGVSYNPDRDLHSHDKDITVRLLRSNNIQNGHLDLNGLQFVDTERVKENQILQERDIVICMANGSKQLVGKSAVFTNRNNNIRYTFGAFMGCFRTDESFASSGYIAANFQSFQYRSYIDILLSGSSINNLNPSNIESILIPFPPLEEQIAIASILSDMDAEITALEERLEKTRTLKSGMMHELLTGRIRLI